MLVPINKIVEREIKRDVLQGTCQQVMTVQRSSVLRVKARGSWQGMIVVSSPPTEALNASFQPHQERTLNNKLFLLLLLLLYRHLSPSTTLPAYRKVCIATFSQFLADSISISLAIAETGLDVVIIKAFHVHFQGRAGRNDAKRIVPNRNNIDWPF